MITAAIRKPLRSVGASARVVIGTAMLLGAAGIANAQTADSPTTVSSVPSVQKGTNGRQLWRLSDYTTIELVAREPGAPANQHPWSVEPNALHAMLQQVQVLRGGKSKALFAIDELNNLVPSLTEAFGQRARRPGRRADQLGPSRGQLVLQRDRRHGAPVRGRRPPEPDRARRARRLLRHRARHRRRAAFQGWLAHRRGVGVHPRRERAQPARGLARAVARTRRRAGCAAGARGGPGRRRASGTCRAARAGGSSGTRGRAGRWRRRPHPWPRRPHRLHRSTPNNA